MKNMKKAESFATPWIIAHRGFKAKYPENTLVAFQAAMDLGIPMIELDVMLSRDRKLVVIHDATLERTTKGHGPVHDRTLEELKQLDAGSWFHTEFKDERLPELTEVIEMANSRVILNIEIKSEAYEAHHPPDAVERQVVGLVKQKKAQDAVLISSFSADILKQISKMPDPPALALISSDPVDDHTIQLCKDINAFSWHPNQKIVTPDQVEKFRTAGLRIFPYSVDTQEDYSKMLDFKVDGVITDDPESARHWLEDKKAGI